MYHPALSEVKALCGASSPAPRLNLVPIYREVLADMETPVSAYLKVTQGSSAGSFLLESVEGGERIARYSFIGTSPRRTLRLRDGQAELTDEAGRLVARYPFADPLEALRQELENYRPVEVPGLPRFHGGAVGYLSYDAASYFERLPRPAPCPLGLPEAVFLITDTLLIFDHLRHRIKVLTHVRLDGNVEADYAEAVARIDELVGLLEGSVPPALPSPVGLSSLPASGPGQITSNYTRAEFEQAVRQAKEYIAAGDVIQVVLSQRLSRPTAAHPFDIYRALRALNPSPYMYYLELGEFTIAGASPELLVRVEDGAVTTHPIAGTRPRGKSAAEDEALEAELRADEKERAEHIMLVDLGRNDVGRVSETGSVAVTQLMGVERYSHVMHLVSHVTGRLRKDRTHYDALRACFPAGTVSGAPKVRAMELIAELEPDQRGPYAGAVGYLDFAGALDTCITIRTIVLIDGVAHIQVGAGIVADSVPALEYQETLNKAMAALRAIDLAESQYSAAPPIGDRGQPEPALAGIDRR